MFYLGISKGRSAVINVALQPIDQMITLQNVNLKDIAPALGLDFHSSIRYG